MSGPTQHVFTHAAVQSGRAVAWLDDENVEIVNVWPASASEDGESTELWIETVRKEKK